MSDGNTKQKKILLVEDDGLLGPLYSFLLQEQNLLVTLITEPTKVQEMILQEKFDLVLLDMMLPGMNGIELLKKILNVNSELKILMLSNLHQPELQEQSLEYGAQGYLIKSELTPDTFLTSVQYYLDSED